MMILRKCQCNAILVTIILAFSFILASAATGKKVAKQEKKDVNDNRGNSMFWLQDPRDGMCLSGHGFGPCDGAAVWIYAQRKKGAAFVALLEHDYADMCLERKHCHSASSPVGIGQCKKCGCKNWRLDRDRRGLYRVSEDHEKNCIVRALPGGKNKYKNTVEMNHCKEGYLGLTKVDVYFNQDGFYLQAADGYCFDGEKFKVCDPRDKSIRWGIGVKFNGAGQGERYLYKAFQPDLCLLKTGKGPTLGDCNSWGSKRWSIKQGRLAQGDGKHCIVRYHDNRAGFAPCKDAFEFISAVPYEPAPVNRLQQPAAYGSSSGY